jgi:hypothetical protein
MEARYMAKEKTKENDSKVYVTFSGEKFLAGYNSTCQVFMNPLPNSLFGTVITFEDNKLPEKL